jgi:hypothetical protein
VLVHNSFLFSAVFSIIKGMMPEKTAKKTFSLHEKDLAKLREDVKI